jgi:Alginate export
VRFILTVRSWRVDAFASKPAETKPGVFDDQTDPTRTFWGVYATGPVHENSSHLDLYYLGLRHSNAKFQQGTAFEDRQILGTRLWGGGRSWDYDVEPLLQFGTFGKGSILAWAVESETGYTIQHARFTPRLGVVAAADSGDHDPTSPDLQTFNPLFPRCQYHELVNLLGHANAIFLNPTATLHVTKKLAITENWEFVWRESVNDGIYGVVGNFVRPGHPDEGRYVGSQPTTLVNWAVQRHLGFIFFYTHFYPGPFIRNSGPSKPVDQVSAWLDFKF